MASEESCANTPGDRPVFSSSFSYWAEVPRGAVVEPYWLRQVALVERPEGPDVRPGGLPDRRVR